MERLLADLEAAQEAQERAEARAEVAESVRVEHAGVTLVDRLRAGICLLYTSPSPRDS